MKLAKILSILTNEPLLCSGDYRTVLLDLFSAHASLDREAFRATRTGIAKSGQELDVEQMEIRNGVAIIPIGGPIATGLGEFEKGAGAVDTDDIVREIKAAENDDSVEAIILNFDSPGGAVCGTPECAEVIAACEKPIYAFSRGSMNSAAYWLAVACDGIFATKSASIGCIGVCAAIHDLSKMADMKGIKVKVFGSGTYKGMGTPGTSLTMQQEAFIQAHIMKLADDFYSHVTANRGAIADGDMQGQSFGGQDALEKGMVDGVVSGLAELESLLSRQ